MDNKKLIPISDLFKKSFEFYKSRLYLVLVLSLIPLVNIIVINLAVKMAGKTPKIAFASGAWPILFLFWLVALVINFWVHIAFFYAIKQQDANADAKSLLAISWSKIWQCGWIAFLMGVISLAGFLLFIVPGVIFSVWFGLSLYVFVFEDIKGMKALYRSKELVQGYWWPVFGRFFVFGICSALAGAIPIVGPLANILFIVPLSTMYGYFIYEDLKRVKL